MIVAGSDVVIGVGNGGGVGISVGSGVGCGVGAGVGSGVGSGVCSGVGSGRGVASGGGVGSGDGVSSANGSPGVHTPDPTKGITGPACSTRDAPSKTARGAIDKTSRMDARYDSKKSLSCRVARRILMGSRAL